MEDFYNPLSEHLISNGVFWMHGLLLAPIYGNGTGFWCTFSACFSTKVEKCSIWDLLYFSRHQTKYFSNSGLAISWYHKLLNLPSITFSHKFNNNRYGKKEQKKEVQKFEYLEKKRSFFGNIKNISYTFISAFF